MPHKETSFGRLAVAVLLASLAGLRCDENETPTSSNAATPEKPPIAMSAWADSPEITPREAKKLLDANEGYLYLDVRTVTEFTDGHVPGSWNIPVLIVNPRSGARESNEAFLSTVQANLGKDARVIVGCRSGARSTRAEQIMLQAGYRNVSNMLGGFVGQHGSADEVIHPGWSMLGYPVERGDGGRHSYALLLAAAEPSRGPKKPLDDGGE